MKEPKIRFIKSSSFLRKQLKDIAIINPKCSLPEIFEYVDLESVIGTEMKNHRTEKKGSAPSRAQRLAQKGDIFFQTVRPYQQNNYYFDLDANNFVFSTGYAQICSKVNPKYLFTILQQSSFLDQVLENCTGTSYPAIAPSALSNLYLNVCVDPNEQNLIASYFQSLDTLIQATTKQLASLKQIKAASLQSMFPQEGETKPRVRFKGFEEEWMTEKLGSLFLERNESNIYGEMLSVTMNNGIIKAADNGRFDNSNKDKSHYKVVKIGDIAYNSMRMWQGASGCSPYDGIVSPAYTVIIPRNGINSLFFAYHFKTIETIKKFRLNSQGLTTDTWNLKYPAFSLIEVLYPSSLDEQQKIASYFLNLDRQITLQTRRLEKLKQIKAACLDKMFV